MNITVLTYLESERARTRDPVVEQVAEALRQAGHQAHVLAVHGDVQRMLDGLSGRAGLPRPDLVFNLMEMFNRDLFGDVDVAGFLDLLDLPHTGGGAGELYLQQDKEITKKILAFEGLKYPAYVVVPPGGDPAAAGHLRFPLFVKPLRLDASLGISARSLVRDAAGLARQVRAIHERLNDSALVEEFVEGREFYVGVLGNADAVALPPIELDFSGLPPGSPRVADSAAKWSRDTVRYRGTRPLIADIPEDLGRRLQEAALRACRALRVRDYGRVDLRLADGGEICVLEVNGNCYLERSAEFAMAAEAAGIAYPDLIARIAELAMERYRTRTRQAATGRSPGEKEGSDAAPPPGTGAGNP